jgi:hypothetical protein
MINFLNIKIFKTYSNFVVNIKINYFFLNKLEINL